MATLESAFEKVKGLVSDFKENENYYLSSEYSEAEVREDYINKFFVALGWDVRHKIQKNPYEQEVKVEKGVKVGRSQKRADYAFHLATNFRDPVFFVEAKKPARVLSNPDDYFQAIRYGWNANTPIVILTDFEEFHIIDSRFKPDIDTALNKKLKYFHYSEYADKEKFAEIYYLFSREAVGNNSIEKYANSLPKPKGKAVKKQLFPGGFQSIDESFLKEIDEIRITLARAYKKSNPSLQGLELTEATHRTIDRLVFIRFLEDKLIEQEHYISEFGESSNAWDDFVVLCKRLDAKYNGVVFKHHFIDEPSFNKPKDVFGNICQDLSHLNSPYDFDKIPIHILGSIYERFLGKVVHATSKRVTIEEKPEVKKVGGVYYTPQYIVRYIVANTVGKLIEGKTPLQISRMRFADIACGSGSFLIAVFETLLDYHNNWYQNNPAKAKSNGCFHQDGKWILSLQQKKNILLNNIYGVDIDSQAVEVTQLSLCLKLMEDESTATANEMQVLFHEQILPDLTKNIVCGNSLIGWDIEDGILFPDEEIRKLNPMDFENAFEKIMNNDGFDAIVGNPPYVRVDTLDNSIKQYIQQNFISAKGKYDLYYLFIETCIKLINNNGIVGYIIPNRFTTSTSGYQLRKLLINKCKKLFINSVSKIRVFKQAATYPNIVIIQGKDGGLKKLTLKETLQKGDLSSMVNQMSFNYEELKMLPDLIFPLNSNKAVIDIYFNLIKRSNLSEQILLIQEGLRISDKIEKEKGDYHILKQYQFTRYSNVKEGAYVKETDLKEWVSFTSKRFINCKKDKLIFAEDALQIEAIIDFSKSICQGGVYFGTLIEENSYDLKFLLGLFNSKLFTIIYKNLFSGMHMGGGYLRFRTSFLNKLPIKTIDFTNKTEKTAHNKITHLVEQMLEAKKKLATAKIDSDINYYERKCNNIDREINNEVYKLYGLSKDEIEIINSD